MFTAPKSLRLQIGIFGRTNVGKSSFLNMVALQDVAITSPVPGTTTDIVEKTMELLPLGPVVFLDTAGLDDTSELSGHRLNKTVKIFDRSDVVVLVAEPNIWTEFENQIVEESRKRGIPVVVAVNKADLFEPTEDFCEILTDKGLKYFFCSSIGARERDAYVNALKKLLIEVCPDDFVNPPTLIGDLVPRGGLTVLIVPIDFEAPKGRIILPQVQTIRDALDSHAAALVVKESEYRQAIENLKRPPDLVVCDSQVVLKMVEDTPSAIPCTTFSILFSRYKGDLIELARGAAAVHDLSSGDKVLISESCSHHALEDDIGRVKIPRWLKQHVGAELNLSVCSGRDYPENLDQYKVIIHCGSCMLTRREMLFRIQQAREAGVPITNYGICISAIQGVIERTLAPFPAALEAYRNAVNLKKEKKQHAH